MKKLLMTFGFLALLSGTARAGVVLSTSNPPGTPLDMTAGTTSGLMAATVTSDNPPNDVMAAWLFQLQILPIGGTGTLSFADPATGSPPNPPNYVFGGNGLGIAAQNTSSGLSANDLFNPGVGSGAPVPGSPTNLLQMDFLASSNAGGLFGIYADEGTSNTVWTDSNLDTQFFTNVPNGTGSVLIGEVDVTAVPEPASLCMLGLGAAGLLLRRRNKAVA